MYCVRSCGPPGNGTINDNQVRARLRYKAATKELRNLIRSCRSPMLLRCRACYHRHSKVWSRSWSDTARPTALARRSRPGSLQWQFTSVWTAAHHRICRSTASRSPVLTRAGICVPPTVTYLPFRVSGSTLMAVGRSQLLARDPTNSTDCFRRLLKTYLFARY